MEKIASLDSIQPRYLRYRSHFKIYLVALLTVSGLVLSFWGHRISQERWQTVYSEYNFELWMSACYFFAFGCFYTFWLRFRLNRVVQVFPTHIFIHNSGKKEEILFDDVESVEIVCMSLFYFKMKKMKQKMK